MSFTISKFRGSIDKANGISRPNLFDVTITDAPAGFPAALFPFQCKIATIPPSTMGVIEVPYFGRMVKMPGNRTFDNLSITVINDTNMQLRGAFEGWMADMNSHQSNETASGGTETCGLTIKHYEMEGGESGEWKFVNCFPVSLGEIGLDWGSNDTAEEFSVDFAYDYWQSAKAQ